MDAAARGDDVMAAVGCLCVGLSDVTVVVAIAVLAGLAARAVRRAQSDLARWTGSAVRLPRLWVGRGLALLVLATLTIAGRWSVTTGGSGPVDVTLVVDLSRSMLTTDVSPDRWSAARADVLRLVETLPRARFRVLAFAGVVREVCPRTADRAAVARFLRELEPRLEGPGGSALTEAVALAGAEPDAAVVVLSDGEDTLGGDPGAAWDPSRVHVMSYGTRAGGLVPGTDHRSRVPDGFLEFGSRWSGGRVGVVDDLGVALERSASADSEESADPQGRAHAGWLLLALLALSGETLLTRRQR